MGRLLMSVPRDGDLQANIATILLWDQGLDQLDYYTLLGVNAEVDPLALERAYHRFALRFHPDRYPECEPSIREALTRIFQRGVEARRVLGDSQLQVRYRNLLHHGTKRMLDDSTIGSVNLDEDLRKLHESCRSAGAKLEAMAAARAWQRGELALVRQCLVTALTFDGNANRSIEGYIEAIEQALRDQKPPSKSP
jgi:curved DNA-binding protein CbpA